jgi:hypothetical protein
MGNITTKPYTLKHRKSTSCNKRYGGIGSPLNPTSSSPSFSSKTKKKPKKNNEYSLYKLVLRNETYKKFPKGFPKSITKPVKRNFVVVDTYH